MGRLSAITLVIASYLMLATAAGAAVPGVLNFTPVDSVYFIAPLGLNSTDVAIDNANRTWYTTNLGGFVAFSGGTKVVGFPIISDLFTPALSSIAFAVADVSGAIQESFFIGSNNFDLARGYVTGAQYGRVLEGSRVSFGEDLCTPPAPPASYSGEITCALLAEHGNISAAGVVNDLEESFSGDKMWVATDRGVTSIDLLNPTLTVNSEMYDAGYNSAPDYAQVKQVIAADPTLSGGSAFYLAQGELHRISGGVSSTFNALSSLAELDAITLDAQGNLWAVERDFFDAEKRIFRYPAADLLAWDGSAANEPILGPENLFSFDPQDPNGSNDFFEERRINAISVNSVTSQLWVATSKGAFYQDFDSASPVLNSKLCSQGILWADPDDDLDGSLPPIPCLGDGGGWHPLPQNEDDVNFGGSATNESFGALLADSNANVWLGSDAGFRSVIARLLTLSGTRFIGVDTVVAITLTDITVVDGDPVSVNVAVGGEVYDLPLTGSGGQYTAAFGFTYGPSTPPAEPFLFHVESTAAGIPITVTYTFENGNKTLIATATWAEIVPFEDDLWIGGPCMIRAMER